MNYNGGLLGLDPMMLQKLMQMLQEKMQPATAPGLLGKLPPPPGPFHGTGVVVPRQGDRTMAVRG